MRAQRLAREPGQVWRALGLAGVLLCAVQAGLLIADSWPVRGSVSEFPALVFGILLVLYWLMPLAAMAVLLGAVPGRGRIPDAIDRRRRIMVWLMRAGALWCLGFGLCLKFIERQGGATGSHPTFLVGLEGSFPVLLPALFAALVWAAAAVIQRPAGSRDRWFAVVLEVCGVIEVAPAAVALSESLPWAADTATLTRIGSSLLGMGLPSLVLVVVIGRTLQIVRRPLTADPP